MTRTSVLNDALKSINNAEKAGKRQVLIRPSSKVITKFLRKFCSFSRLVFATANKSLAEVMQKHGMFDTAGTRLRTHQLRPPSNALPTPEPLPFPSHHSG